MEQALAGDLLLIDVKENMNEGKTYYMFKYLADVLFKTHRYRYVAKVDDDTYLHIPHFFSWMGREKNFSGSAGDAGGNVVFGGNIKERSFFYVGAFYGLSTHLLLQVIGRVELKYRGGKLEDQLFGAWVRLYGSDVADVRIDPSLMAMMRNNMQLEEQAELVLGRSQQLVFFHGAKKITDWLYLYRRFRMELDMTEA